MTDAPAVKRALAALASDDYVRVVRRAADATADVRAAAAFARQSGRTRLRQALREAERRGDDATAREGRAALRALERYRLSADHFHSARGTVLRGDGQPRDD